MNQITLRQIPENVDALIRQLSKEQKKSINKTIIELEKALGWKRRLAFHGILVKKEIFPN